MAQEKTTIEVTEDNEMDLITGLLSAADYKKDITKKITIQREAGKPLFSFRIHPLSVDDIDTCRKQATTYMENPNNSKLPPIAKDTSEPDFLAWEIYYATEGEFGSKLWDNQELKKGLQDRGKQVMTSTDIIKTVLLSGEMVAISNVIDRISGDNADLVDYAKN